MEYKYLFSPIGIGTMQLKNRVVMNAAELGLGQTNGCPTPRMMDYYEARAKGGVGLIIPGICRVNDMGATSTFTQLSMSSDYHIEPMREMAARLHRHGAKLCIQLHHPGRQGYASSINSLPLIIPLAEKFPSLPDKLFKATPLLLGLEQKKICMSVQSPSGGELSAHGATRIHAMSKKAIKRLIADFVAAAARCKAADVDAVELHGTHGYLIQQFLSPNTNKRTDEYGGSFENRMRFLEEIVTGIKQTCGRDYPLIVRLCVDEMYDRIGQPGKGYGLDTGVAIARRLEALGVDAIDVSSACYDTYNYWLEPTTFEPGWRRHLARAVKEAVNIPVIAANFIRSPEQAERQIAEGDQDLAGSARNFICDPDWAKKAMEGRENEIRRCIGCLHCIRSFIANAAVGKVGECALNMFVGREQEEAALEQTGEGKKVVVVGAGPAGLEAAITLAKRGFSVNVLEKEYKPGGQVRTAAMGPRKEKLGWCIEDLMREAERLGVTFFFGVEADARDLAAMQPYAVVLASGGTPVRPGSIFGINSEQVHTAPEILQGEAEIKDSRVLVVGSGLTGLETAEKLANDGNRVTVLEMADEIAPGAWFQFVDDAMAQLEKSEVRFLTGAALVSIHDGYATAVDVKKKKNFAIETDAVVLAMGVRPDRRLLAGLEEAGVRTVVVGDAEKGGTIAAATHSAFEAAMTL